MNAQKELELVDTVLSGNAWKVRILCGFLGIPLKRRTLSIVDGDLEKESFASINPSRQIPVLRTREDTWLPESPAILWYLAQGTDFLPRQALQQAEVVRWLTFEQTLHMVNFAQPRLLVTLRKVTTFDDDRVIAWQKAGRKALDTMESELSTRPFFVGHEATIADIALYPYTSMADEAGYDLSPYPKVQAWLERMTAMPGFTPLL
jgi:glutathione S-transferase